MKQEIKERVIKHINDLQAFFKLPDMTESQKLNLARKLRRLEATAHGLQEKQCNGTIEEADAIAEETKIMDKLDALLDFRKQEIPVFINGDPRGYALKIEDDYTRNSNKQIHRDWGGYGIIAPDLSED